MCHLCNKFSRRRFLRWSLSAFVSMSVLGCRSVKEVTPVPTTAVPTAIIPTSTPMPSPIATLESLPERPFVAGILVTITDRSVVLSFPIGKQTYQLSDEFVLPSLMRGQAVLLWGESGRVTAVTPSPPMTVTPIIPEGLAQSEPTGETIDFYGLPLMTRAGWGADEPRIGNERGFFDAETNPSGWLAYSEPLSRWLNTLVVHHSALEWVDGPRAIQQLHILQSGFADVGYHFLIDGGGNLYEGRPLAIRGAHTGGYNTGTIGVCLLGNFEVAQPTMAQLDTLVALATALKPNVTLSHLTGHKGFQPNATLCPGANLWPLLPDLAQQTRLMFGTDGYERPPWS